MEFTTLTIEFPRLDGEQAFMMQQALYAFLDAFDTHHCFTIERYLQDRSNPDDINSINETLKQLLKNAQPF